MCKKSHKHQSYLACRSKFIGWGYRRRQNVWQKENRGVSLSPTLYTGSRLSLSKLSTPPQLIYCVNFQLAGRQLMIYLSLMYVAFLFEKRHC